MSHAEGAPRPPCDISVTIFCQNEADRIAACLQSIASAGRSLHLGITVIANGTRDRSITRAAEAIDAARLPARIYEIAYPDKSNAINHSFAALRQAARLHVFVDAYAVIARDSFTGFATVLSRHHEAVAATGIAGNGRTMIAATEETLDKGGRLHGQLHAFRPSFLDRLVAAGLKLPIGLYRGDGLLGSMACHDLKPLENPWDGNRIRGTREAVYTIPQLSPFRPRDVLRQFRRKIRQMRGRMENAALQDIIYGQGFEALPRTADRMILDWLAKGGTLQTPPPDRPFMALALRRVRAAQPPDPAALEPALRYATE